VGDDDPIDEVSGEVRGVDELEGDLSESSPEFEDVEDGLLGNISGALYESIFVVEMSSIGAEILCLIVPEEEKECFAVRDRFGISGVLSLPPLDLLVVKALERDIFANMAESITYGPNKMG